MTNRNMTAIHGMRITRDLHQAEAALDEALILQAKLLATMVAARRESGVAPFTGQDALLRLASSQKSVLHAGGELARVHGKLLDIGREFGSGTYDDCPPTGSLDEHADLSTAQLASQAPARQPLAHPHLVRAA